MGSHNSSVAASGGDSSAGLWRPRERARAWPGCCRRQSNASTVRGAACVTCPARCTASGISGWRTWTTPSPSCWWGRGSRH